MALLNGIVIGHLPSDLARGFSLLPLLAQLRPALGHAGHALFAHFRGSAQWISRHTGIPALFVAAALIVASWRMARRIARVAVEVCVVAALLLALTKLGVVTW